MQYHPYVMEGLARHHRDDLLRTAEQARLRRRIRGTALPAWLVDLRRRLTGQAPAPVPRVQPAP